MSRTNDNRVKLIVAALLAPLAAPLVSSLLLLENPLRTLFVQTQVLVSPAVLATWLCILPLYLLLQRPGIANWWTAGLTGAVALALLPLWIGLLSLALFGLAPPPSVRELATFYADTWKAGLFLLSAPSAILTGLAFHALVRAMGSVVLAGKWRQAP